MKTIASERALLGLSQADLADRLGVSRQTVLRWESGAVIPPVPHLLAMSDLFGCSVDFLLGLTKERVIR